MTRGQLKTRCSDLLDRLETNRVIVYVFAVYVAVGMLNSTTLYKYYMDILENGLAVGAAEMLMFRVSQIFALAVKAIRYVCYLYFAGRILRTVVREKKLPLAVLIMGVVAVVVLFCSRNRDLFFLTLALTAMRGVDPDEVMRKLYPIYALAYLMVVLLALLGIIPDWEYLRSGGSYRHSLGFMYPTHAIGFFIPVCLLFMIVRRTNATYWELLVMAVINAFLFGFTDGRLGFAICAIVLVVMLAAKVVKARFSALPSALLSKKWVNGLLKCGCLVLPLGFFVLALALSVLQALNFGPALKINDILSDRLLYNARALLNYRILPFGFYVDWIGWGGSGFSTGTQLIYNFVDMSYVRMLFDFGFLPTAAILTIFSIKMEETRRRGNYWLLAGLAIVLLWSFVEPYLVTVAKNVFLVYFASYLDWKPLDLAPLFDRAARGWAGRRERKAQKALVGEKIITESAEKE